MFNKILIANRGEIALRIARAAQELSVASVAVFARDDARMPHLKIVDKAVASDASGPAAYLDADHMLAVALEEGCDAIHPGYGFLSENAGFARACANVGIHFIGPTPEQLELFGDKAQARELAQRCGIPLMPGSEGAVTLAEAEAFLATQDGNGVILKAIGGGGGRGIRVVTGRDELPAAWESCRREALAAAGTDGVYVERLMPQARHIELQLLGDGQDVIVLGERECTLQRRFQKIVEVAPSPTLPDGLRQQMALAALKMAQEVRYQNLGTFEFLVDLESTDLPFVFMEVNPRLQVEHTITEEVFGVDLVQAQIRLAAGASLKDLKLDPATPPRPSGFAVQWRINAETLDAQGQATPHSGTITRFDLPSGPGVRIDTHGFVGAAPSPHYDTLLAKLIVHTRGQFTDTLRRSQRALAEFHVTGLPTNLPLLRALAARPEMPTLAVHTRWLQLQLPQLLKAAQHHETKPNDPLPSTAAAPTTAAAVPDHAMTAMMPARLVQWSVAEGDEVPAGAELGVLEAMKMEHVISAPHAGRVTQLLLEPGDYVEEGAVLLVLLPVETPDTEVGDSTAIQDPDFIRPDLQRVLDRWSKTDDAARPETIAKRHRKGLRTARENIADLCDKGSFIEYGAFAVASQTSRRTMADLVDNTPADGMVTGIGRINTSLFGTNRSSAVVMSYDATVFAGTQGRRNHAKTDRMIDIAFQQKLPVVLFAEGGGGRPGDDSISVSGLHLQTFAKYAQLSGQVPVIGITTRYCFAGNAALLGCSDVIIATEDSNIGMGGPAMIEGGGLGLFKPEDIGPSQIQHGNGVIDILVADEAEAVATARQYLSYFQGPTNDWDAPDQRLLRQVVPENRLRVYDTRQAMAGLVDAGSLLPLRTGFGVGIHTALARIAGRPVGLMASNPSHLGGAIDAPAADKAARFMQLCNAHGLPLVSLVDTPGFMVGPDIERTAQVRHVSRMFVVAAHLRVPFFSIVLRKGYGLGAMAMTAGSFHAPLFNIAWPTGEFGGMGLEGYVRLGFKKELDAAPEGPERDALFARLLAERYEFGQAINMATYLEIDAVIDPSDTRDWLVRGLASARTAEQAPQRFVDTW